MSFRGSESEEGLEAKSHPEGSAFREETFSRKNRFDEISSPEFKVKANKNKTYFDKNSNSTKKYYFSVT
jgi:hypothetical protein